MVGATGSTTSSTAPSSPSIGPATAGASCTGRAGEQREAQHAIVIDRPVRTRQRDQAKRLRGAGRDADRASPRRRRESVIQSDFYSYRYFASEGFLPGYSFPRLPLSAFIPGRRGRRGRRRVPPAAAVPGDLASSGRAASSTTRARATSSTGSSSPSSATTTNRLPTIAVKQCSSCGYLHPVAADDPGPRHVRALRRTARAADHRACFRLQNVVDEAARPDQLRRGGARPAGLRAPHRVRFADARRTRTAGRAHRQRRTSRGGSSHTAAQRPSGASTSAGRAGRTRTSSGSCSTSSAATGRANEQAALDDPDDPMSERQERVIPYVEDRRNALALRARPSARRPTSPASLAAALKNAIQVVFHLEDTELAVEPLPNRDFRNKLLFYESAEGGAGVLRQLAIDPDALRRVARAGARALPLRPRHRRRPRHAPRRARGLRGGLLRLPAELRQPVRPPAARSPRDLATFSALLRRRRGRGLAGFAAARRSRSNGCCRSATPSSSALRPLPRRERPRAADHTPRNASTVCAPSPTSPTRTMRPSCSSTAHRTTSRTSRSATARQPTRLEDGGYHVIRVAARCRLVGHRRRQHPSVFGGTARELRRRLARQGARPRVGRAARSPRTTCSSCGRSAAPTTRSPASSPRSRRSSRRPSRLPDPTELGDYRSCRLLRDALRLGFRSSAGPFRSLRRGSPSSRAPTSSCRC